MITGKYKWREKERRGGEGDPERSKREGRRGGKEEREGSDMDHWLS